MDIAQDGVLGCPEALEEIFSEVTTPRPDLKEKLAGQALGIRPELLGQIQKITGLTDIQAGPPRGFHSIHFSKRASAWLQGEPSPLSTDGKVIKVVGTATVQGQPIKRGQTLPQGASIRTGLLSQVMFLPAPGVIAEVQQNSEVIYVQGSQKFEKGLLRDAQANLKTVSGDVHFAIADGFGEKIRVEVSTPRGCSRLRARLRGTRSRASRRKPSEPLDLFFMLDGVFGA